MGITAAEYRRRIERLGQRLAEEGLDLFIVSAEESILYLTGVAYTPLERPFFILVRPDAAPTLLVPTMERDHLASTPAIEQVQTYWDYPAPSQTSWRTRLDELIQGATNVAVEPSMPLEIAQHLADRQARALPLVEEMRLVKSPAEIALLRHAARYADMGVERILRTAYHGVSLLELFSQGRSVQLAMLREVGYNAVISGVTVGAWPAPGSAMPHDVPAAEARLRQGPHIALALTRVQGYCAECERTFFVAPPDPQVREAFAAMREATRRAIELARPGVPCAELDEAANGFLRDEGYGPYLLHRTGHGFGLSGHEGPWIAAGSTDVLEPGMLISVEPGIYFPEVGGVRHSDTILITDDGAESLTHQPRDLDALTIHQAKPAKRLIGALTRRMAGL